MDAELIRRLEDAYLRAATPNDQRAIMDAIAALSATPQAAQVPEALTMDDAERMGKSLEWWRGYTACLNAMQARVEFAAAQAQGVGHG